MCTFLFTSENNVKRWCFFLVQVERNTVFFLHMWVLCWETFLSLMNLCLFLEVWKWQKKFFFVQLTWAWRAYFDRGSVDPISLDIFTWLNFTIKRLKISQLIEKFDQVKKSISSFLAVDRKFKITKNDIIRTFDQVPKFASYFLAVDRNFLN